MCDEKVFEYLKKMDFMKLGKAISESNWQIAMMTVSRLQNDAKTLEITEFDNYYPRLRQCIAAKNRLQGLNIMSQITSKRVSLINNYKSREEK